MKSPGMRSRKEMALLRNGSWSLQESSLWSCFSEKAAVAIERSIDWDVPLFDGVNLVRNGAKPNTKTRKSLNSFGRLRNALFDFIDTHALSISPAELVRGSAGLGRSGGGGSGGIFNVDKKDLRKEKKYYRYAFMVLLGIFGLTGPLVMKILGVVAAHSLLAAKAALIIVGSVALKKIFERDEHKKPNIKVHTVQAHDSEEQEYDRKDYAYNHIPYGYSGYNSNHHPYSAYGNNNFAPVFYGTPYDSKKTKHREPQSRTAHRCVDMPLYTLLAGTRIFRHSSGRAARKNSKLPLLGRLERLSQRSEVSLSHIWLAGATHATELAVDCALDYAYVVGSRGEVGAASSGRVPEHPLEDDAPVRLRAVAIPAYVSQYLTNARLDSDQDVSEAESIIIYQLQRSSRCCFRGDQQYEQLTSDIIRLLSKSTTLALTGYTIWFVPLWVHWVWETLAIFNRL
ncbi:hypothetical protein NQ318_020273 [Aromia moschata]|uniref:Uncharacterized protein n=1 Tax=Aromia moschata TaxID=1265417 RepID=A0AAV8ZBQ2_9CUCU|nr:hypothetical protein NQ318_020273 [Aromia moschata]